MDDFSPIYVGDTGAPFAPQFLHKDGTPMDLSGATITMQMVSLPSRAIANCAGNWTIDDAVNGKAHYDYTSNDVGTVGFFEMLIEITKNSKPVHADSKILEIKALTS